MQKSAFDKISIKTAFESFCVFLVAGMLVVIVGGCFVDLTGNLPNWYLSLIQEPVAIVYFFILSIGSLLLTAMVTWGGTKNHNEKWWFEKLLLAVNRAGISCGFIASGMLIGIGVGLFAATRGAPDSHLATASLGFVEIGGFCLSVACFVSLLMLHLINQDTNHNFMINFFNWVYVAIIFSMGFKFRENVYWVVSFIFAVIIAFTLTSSSWLRRANNNSSQ